MRALLLLLAAAAFAAGPEIEVAAVATLAEGPTADRHGNVYFSDMFGVRILKADSQGRITVFRQDSNVAHGMIFDRQGRLIACEGSDETRRRPRVTRTDIASGRVEVIAERVQGEPLHMPCDVTLDGRDRIYFTDRGPAGKSGVYRIDPDGRVARIAYGAPLESPNGIVVSPDDRTLYMVESNRAPGGARLIRAWDLQPDGTLRRMRVFHDFQPGRSADGLCIDVRGNLYAAAGLNRLRGGPETLDTKAGVFVFAPGGNLLRFIPVYEDIVTNCTFGGPDMKTLYITAGKTLFKIRNDIEGTGR